MEAIKNIYLFVLVLLCSFLVNAQELESNNATAITKLLNKETITLGNIGLDNVKSNTSYLLNRNIVQISQMGNANEVDLHIRSSKSKLVIFQDGSNNSLEVYKDAKQLNQTIVQSGKNNFISDVSAYYGKSIDMVINQEGNNLKFVNSGTNSISKDLKITQQGNSGSVFIFNY